MPKPQVQILVCTNERSGSSKPSCGACGSMKVYHRFKDRLKELGLRDRMMVVRTGCLKHCSQGPVVAVWPQNFWYRDVSAKDVDEILKITAERGQEVERLRMPDIPWE